MAQPKVHITGLKELRRELRAIDKKLPRQVGIALKRAAEVAAADAASRAPRRTGGLASSVRAGLKGTTVAFIGSKLVYAGIQEFGGRAARNRSALIPAHPYLRPAVEANAGEAARVATDAIEQILRERAT